MTCSDYNVTEVKCAGNECAELIMSGLGGKGGREGGRGGGEGKPLMPFGVKVVN